MSAHEQSLVKRHIELIERARESETRRLDKGFLGICFEHAASVAVEGTNWRLSCQRIDVDTI